ncbi:hypothetical protein [Kitasatospora sp. NPDC093679]|uniref:hypothetical protein n=1 Tax=Kitasatospora sp. NPDC093679 TaxID=3154983 RepID=UPI00343D3371
MSNQGASPHDRPEDGWWQAVYAGPAGTLPDAPGAAAGEGSVDDWFDSASGMIGPQRAASPKDGSPTGGSAGGPDAAPDAPPQAAPPAPKASPIPPRPHWAPPVKAEQEPAAEPGPGPAPGRAPSRPHWASAANAEKEKGNAGQRNPAAVEPLVDEPLLDEFGVAGPAAEGTGIDEPSVDDWFDMAAGVIGGPRPAPATAGEAVPSPAPAAEDAEPEPEPTMRLGTVRRPARDPGPAPDPAPVAAAPVDDAEPDPTMTLGTVRRPAAPAPSSAPEPASPSGAQPEPQSTPAPPSAPEPASRFEPQPESAADLRPAGQPSTPEPGPAVVLRKPAAPTGADRAEPFTPAVPADRAPAGAAAAEPAEDRSRQAPRRVPLAPPVPHVGERPPTYSPEPTALPAADPADLDVIVPDTVLEGAQYGPAILRAASVRGDSARFRGEPRRDALLVTRFGEGEDGLLLAVIASPARSADAAAGSAAAAEAARQLAAAIGRSRAELAADLRAGARDRLRYGLQRLTVGAAARLRPSGEPAVEPGDGEAGALHCLLVPLDGEAGHRAAFGTGPGGLYLLRSGHWIDAYAARLLHHPDGEPQPAAPAAAPKPFRFRMVPATTGDILLLCTAGLAGPIADEPAVARFLSNHWAHPHPPGSVDFLRQVQVRAKGYADDRTAAALWTE